MKKILKKLAIAAVILVMILSTACGNENKKAERHAKKMLASMSLEEKIAQMIMPAFRNWTIDGNKTEKITKLNPEIQKAIADYGFGGVILFAENTQGTVQTTELICDMQEAAMTSNNKIPLFVAVDQEGGSVYRLATGTAGCGNMALGATSDEANAKVMASIIGSELAAEGFNVDFAPDMDINNNPNNPVIGVRSFSDDSKLVAKMGTAFVEGLKEEKILSALKHFPGHGNTITDSHSGLPSIDLSLEALKENELIPFKAGIDAGADMIMTAHIQYPQIEKETYLSISTGKQITLPATLSKTIITDLLRSELGFDGVVVTDALGMGAISEHFYPLDSARLAINAGVDILLMPIDVLGQEDLDAYGEYIQGIANMVAEGKIEESVIDAAATRILKLKYARGIMDQKIDKASKVQTALSVVGSKAHHDSEWDITSKAITLVKNDGMLPVKNKAKTKVAFFVAYENEGNCVDYALDRIGSKVAYEISSFTKMTELTAEQKAMIDRADYVITDVESSGVASMNSELASGWQAAFIDNLITYTHAQGKQVAVISIQLPYDVARYQKADAIIAAYNSKGMNEVPIAFNGETLSYGPNLSVAVAAALGDFSPTGKLPVNIFKLNSKYEYTYDLLYASGHGLSYE